MSVAAFGDRVLSANVKAKPRRELSPPGLQSNDRALRMVKFNPLFVAVIGVFLNSGCATVSTQVVRLDPSLRFAPSERVEILLEKPRRPYTEIALLESRGIAGGGEAELLEAAREKARELGADAVVRLEVDKTVQPPVAVYEPIFSPFYYPYPFYRYPYVYPPFYGEYRLIGGGTVYTLRALAIKYDKEAEREK